jgi:hypothetical protein
VSKLPPSPDRPGPHPEPPADLQDRGLPIADYAAPLLRVHRACFKPLFFGRTGDARFDAPNAEYGVLYAGEDAHCAFIETFGQSTGINTVSSAALAQRSLARITPRRTLRLVDLTGPGLARLGADERLCSGEHRIAQRWAMALWSHPEALDGLVFRARHDPSRRAFAIFDRAQAELVSVSLGSLLDPPNHALLGDILDTYRFDLI